MNSRILQEQVYIDYKDRVNSYIKGKVSNCHDAEDLLSSIFLKVYKNLDGYDSEKASLSTWIYTISHNEVCNYYRAKSKHGYTEEIDKIVRLSQEQEPFVEKLIKEEEIEDLAKALEQLPERERDIIILRFYHGYTPAEVGDLMKISYSNCKFLQHRAIKKLKSIMIDQ